jgi:hypothetical protein
VREIYLGENFELAGGVRAAHLGRAVGRL